VRSVRQTPLRQGLLRLMTPVTEMGAMFMPPVSAFCAKPKTTVPAFAREGLCRPSPPPEELDE